MPQKLENGVIKQESPFLSYNQKEFCIVCLYIFAVVYAFWLNYMHKISKMDKYLPKEKFNVSYDLRGLELS